MLGLLPALAWSQARLRPEFQVNSFTTGTQYSYGAAVASDANANFVVVWTSFGQEGMGYEVFGQRYQASGARLGGEFRVNTSSSNDQITPAKAAAADGAFVVVWNSDGQDGSGWGVFAQRFASPDVIFQDGFE
jgi:hypothetical protein